MNEHNLFYVKEDVIQWMTQVYSEKKEKEKEKHLQRVSNQQTSN